jgi:hypothetical protein
MNLRKYPSLSAVLATKIIAAFGFDGGKPATYISPVGQYGIVPYSELAMHTKIADQPIVQYALFGEPGQPAKYAHVKLADGRWNHGLPGEVLSWEARNLHGGEKVMIPSDKYPALSKVLAAGYDQYSNEELQEMINKESAKADSKKLEKLRREMAYRKITPDPTVMTGKPELKPWDGTRYTGMPKNSAKTSSSTESKKKVLSEKDKNTLWEEKKTKLDALQKEIRELREKGDDASWAKIKELMPQTKELMDYLYDIKPMKSATAGVNLTNESALRAFEKGFQAKGPKHGDQGVEIRFERANDMEVHGSVNLHAENFQVSLPDPTAAAQLLEAEGHGHNDYDDGSVDYDVEIDTGMMSGFMNVLIKPEEHLAVIDAWCSAYDDEDDESSVEEKGELIGREMTDMAKKLKAAKKQ